MSNFVQVIILLVWKTELHVIRGGSFQLAVRLVFCFFFFLIADDFKWVLRL